MSLPALAFCAIVMLLLAVRNGVFAVWPAYAAFRANRYAGAALAVLGFAGVFLLASAALAADGTPSHPAGVLWLRNLLIFVAVVAGVFLAVVCGTKLCSWAQAALVASIAFMLGPGSALAAGEPTVYSIALPKDLVATLVDYVFLALAGGVGWLIRRAAGWLHLSRESLLVQRFDHGAEAALAYAREQILLRAGDLGDVRTRSELVKVAGEYLLPKIPGVLKELKIDPAGLYDRLAARLDVVAPHPGAGSVAGLPR